VTRHWFIVTLPRSSSKVEVTGQTSRSPARRRRRDSSRRVAGAGRGTERRVRRGTALVRAGSARGRGRAAEEDRRRDLRHGHADVAAGVEYQLDEHGAHLLQVAS